jgi:hypothetical protein
VDLPRPEVTVTDPRQPGTLRPAPEPVPARLGRRGTALLAAAAVVGAGALVAADVVRDRRDAVEQRRLDGVVDVALGGAGARWASSYDARTGTGTVGAPVRLVNRGPRDVRVTSASLGALRARDAPTLPAGGDGELWLQRSVRCPADGSPPPPEPEVRELRLAVEAPGGREAVVLEGSGLPAGSLDDSVQRACLHPPLREAVQLTSTVVAAQERTVVLRVDVSNTGRVPVRLLSLVPARGLVVESVTGTTSTGASVGLPVVLPLRTERPPAARTLVVRLGVICGALLGADLLTPFEELSAIVEDEERSQLTSVSALTSDPDVELRQLAGRTCSSG